VERIERDDGALGDPEFGEQCLRRWDFVGFLGDIDMRQHQRGVGGEGAEDLRCNTIIEVVEASAERFAIQCDGSHAGGGPCGLQQSGMATEHRLHIHRVEALEDVADSCVGGRAAPFQTENGVQLIAMDIDEGDDAAI